MARLRHYALAAAVLAMLVWAAFMLELRANGPTLTLQSEEPAMVEWDHLTETGGVIHVRVVRSDYRTEGEYQEAIQGMLKLFPPNIPPSGG